MTASCRRCFASSFKAKSIAGSSSTRSRRANGSLLLGEGQNARDERAAPDLAPVVQLAAVLREGGPCHRRAEPGPLLPCGEEGSADAIQDLARHAPAGIADQYFRSVLAKHYCHFDMAAAGGRVDGLRHQG